MDISLNFYDVQTIANKKLCLIMSPDLRTLTLNDLFRLSDYVVINYLSRENYGHWVCLYYNRRDNIINFFDSYGGMPDDQLKFIPYNFRLASNQNYPYLLKMLYRYKGEVQYNYKKLQGPNTTTCGRWCGLYLKYCDLLTIDQFSMLISNVAKKLNVSTDSIVYELTKY
jgi:hypothetical protein